MSEDDKKYLHGKFSELIAYVDERAEKLETKLLSAFHGWARSMEIRTRVVLERDKAS